MVVKFYGWFSGWNRNNRVAAYEQLLDLISRQLLIKKVNKKSRLLINFTCKNGPLVWQLACRAFFAGSNVQSYKTIKGMYFLLAKIFAKHL